MALWRSRPRHRTRTRVCLPAAFAVCAAVLAGTSPTPAGAQTPSTAAPEGVLVLNQDALFGRSQYGQRLQRELEAASTALATENREIEAQLTAEELRLTDQRATMAPDAFRLIAEEFDVRVGEIRRAQEAKAQSLNVQAETVQQQFFDLAFPILLELVQERGAAVLMDNRAVLLSAETVDITAAALERIDAQIGDGGDAPLLDMPALSEPLPRPPAPEPDDAEQ